MKDEKFLINGGNKLFGEVIVDSSKNAYLPILAGCVLSEGRKACNTFTFLFRSSSGRTCNYNTL